LIETATKPSDASNWPSATMRELVFDPPVKLPPCTSTTPGLSGRGSPIGS